MSRYRSRLTRSRVAVSTDRVGRVAVVIFVPHFRFGVGSHPDHTVDLLYGAILKDFSRARS
jgi:hypothetical protein